MSDLPPPPYQQFPSGAPAGRTPSQSTARPPPQQQQQQYAPPPGPPPGFAGGPPVPPHDPQRTSTIANNNNPFASHMGPGQSAPSGYNPMQSNRPGYAPAPGNAAVPLGRQGSVSAQATTLGSPQVGRSGSSSASREDPLDMLKEYDTIIIVDDSGSMQLSPDAGGPSRWEEARDALAGLVYLASKKDQDGIDLHFLNSPHTLKNCRDPKQVKALFDSITPDGITPTGTTIEMLNLEYLDEIETYKQKKAAGQIPPSQPPPKRRNYLVVTDGASSDDLESVIIAIARRLDEGRFPLSQVGFSFIQVGDDPEAAEALKELDDAVQSTANVRDIVDTTLYSGMALNSDQITKALLGGINKRWDRKNRGRVETLI